ncbi:MAG: RNA-binding protein [Saprospiraceae bacterium]|jgi:RNA recognition motif-containing protein|nr:RNA-binding protein [Saprospiraceae bacterium]
MKIYVSNLGFDVNDSALNDLFTAHGAVVSAKVILDRETGRSRGFGFVEMSDEESGKNAIRLLNNQDINGRPISVSIAKDKSQLGSSTSFNRGGNTGGGFKKRW